MRLDRWNLEKAGKWLAIAACCAFAGSRAMGYVHRVAGRRAREAVEWHELNHHHYDEVDF